ncbi:MAG TPA: MBL fold metallo-hydrolase [Bacteroidota bacterium]|nr:MBL fold metallo-hydrolase [Bacteroidota bacterium]
MVHRTSLFACALIAVLLPLGAAAQLQKDTISTTAGKVEITFVGHATLALRWGEKTVLVDPWSKLAGFSELPKADLILVTHHHGDHFDTAAIAALRSPSTVILLTAICAPHVPGSTVMKNGDVKKVLGLTVEAVPAYNLVHMRPDGIPFHPKGEGYGYVVTIGLTRIYIAGDTEGTPEMKALKNIDVAFLPMNLPYTMTPEMVAEAAKAFRPKILYPYHYSQTDTAKVAPLFKDAKGIELRIRNMK